MAEQQTFGQIHWKRDQKTDHLRYTSENIGSQLCNFYVSSNLAMKIHLTTEQEKAAFSETLARDGYKEKTPWHLEYLG